MVKKFLIKIDRLFLDQLTGYTKRWIAKHDYKKHKVDLQIRLEWFQLLLLLVLAMIIPTVIYIVAREFNAALFQFGSWSVLFVLHYIKIKNLSTIKMQHDLSFSLRKNPEVYEVEKKVLDYMFLIFRKRRIITQGFLTSFTSTVSSAIIFASFFASLNTGLYVGIFLLLSHLISTITSYIFFVFDFDEPEPKKKPKESLTAIVAREWQNLIGGLVPKYT